MHSRFGDVHQRCMEIYGSRTDREREKKRGKEKETEEKQRPANQKHSIYTRRPHMNEAVASAGPGTTPGHHTWWNSDMTAILSLVS